MTRFPRHCVARAAHAALICGLAAAGPALAQEAPPPDAPAAATQSVTITGSRIRTLNQESSSPVTAVSSKDIAITGKTNVQEIVNKVGALAGSDTDSEVSTGESTLILRNLGAARTLVLVDGQRFVPGFAGSAAVDINAIPSAMIERVEIFTGGASAIYGADAVTGVVNFILKNNFEGLAIDGQWGGAQRGSFRDQQMSLTGGHNFDGGRGNLTLGYTFGDRPLVLASARPESSTLLGEQINNPNGAVPKYIMAPGTREVLFTDGGALIDPFSLFSANGFNGDGTPFQHGSNVGGFHGTTEFGGDGLPTYKLFAQGIRPGNRRHLLTLKGQYEVSEAFTPYATLNYARVQVQAVDQESLSIASMVAPDNPFLPAGIADAAAAANAPIMFNRWDLDAGFWNQTATKDTWRVVGGARGELGAHAHYDVSVNLGQSKGTYRLANNRLYDRFLAAIDAVVDPATGQVVCRSTLDPNSFKSLVADGISTNFDPSLGAVTFTPGAGSGCVPFNPFTKDNSVNQQALAWIWQPTTSWSTNRQTVVTGFIGADTAEFLKLPGGPLDVIVGSEFRKESSSVAYDAYAASTRNVTFFPGADVAGSFDVKELFAEVSAPLFKNEGEALRALTLDAALRMSSYSTIGRTNTWSLRGRWDTVGGLMVRGTVSSAVRAPNINDLYSPNVVFPTSLGSRDPCNVDNLGFGSSYRAANCAAVLNGFGIDPTTFHSAITGSGYFNAVGGGNPDLEAETARSRTLGVVWSVPGADAELSADYFDIDLTQAITNVTAQALFDACYDSPTLDNPFCARTGRDPTTGWPNQAQISPVNVARQRTSGVDFSGLLRVRSADWGDWRFTMGATWLRRLDVQKSLVPALTDDKGLFNTTLGGSSPIWTVNLGTTWQQGAWDASYGFNFSSSTLRSPPLNNTQRAEAYDIIAQAYIKPYRNHDVQVGYRFTKEARAYAGINNLTGEMPGITLGSLNGPSGRQGYAGRVFYVGVNLKFGEIWN